MEAKYLLLLEKTCFAMMYCFGQGCTLLGLTATNISVTVLFTCLRVMSCKTTTKNRLNFSNCSNRCALVLLTIHNDHVDVDKGRGVESGVGDPVIPRSGGPEAGRNKQIFFHGLHLGATVQGTQPGDRNGRYLVALEDDVQSGRPRRPGATAFPKRPQGVRLAGSGVQLVPGPQEGGREC